MTTKQLEVIERDLLFVKDPVVGTDIYYRFGQEEFFAQYNHFERRRNKFAQPIGDQFEFTPVVEIHRDNLIWRDNKYVIPVRLLNPFFAVASQISADLTIRFNIEKDVKKLFENTMRIEDQAVREDVDRNP